MTNTMWVVEAVYFYSEKPSYIFFCQTICGYSRATSNVPYLSPKSFLVNYSNGRMPREKVESFLKDFENGGGNMVKWETLKEVVIE